MIERYEGRGASLEDATNRAVEQIPPQDGKDYATGRVVEWGLQRGGFIDQRLFYVIVESDDDAAFRTEGDAAGL